MGSNIQILETTKGGSNIQVSKTTKRGSNIQILETIKYSNIGNNDRGLKFQILETTNSTKALAHCNNWGKGFK